MTKVSFEIEPSKIKALQSALKALGIENITIEKTSDSIISEETIRKIENAHKEYQNGETQKISPEKLWENI